MSFSNDLEYSKNIFNNYFVFCCCFAIIKIISILFSAKFIHRTFYLLNFISIYLYNCNHCAWARYTVHCTHCSGQWTVVAILMCRLQTHDAFIIISIWHISRFIWHAPKLNYTYSGEGVEGKDGVRIGQLLLTDPIDVYLHLINVTF